MKKIYILTALSVLIVLTIFSFATTVSASSASLYVLPASKSVVVGDTISGSVGISTGGNKIYAIEGTLVFDKLTCQSIAVSEGVQALATPTCANPKFVLGIASGSSVDKTLFSITSKAGTAGTASISLTGVKIVGGESISVISTSGGNASYTVGADVKEPEAVIEPIVGTITTPASDPIKSADTAKKPVTAIEVTPVVSTTEDEAINQSDGSVLAGYEEQIPDETNWLTSDFAKILGALTLIVVLILIGWFILKKKKL